MHRTRASGSPIDPSPPTRGPQLPACDRDASAGSDCCFPGPCPYNLFRYASKWTPRGAATTLPRPSRIFSARWPDSGAKLVSLLSRAPCARNPAHSVRRGKCAEPRGKPEQEPAPSPPPARPSHRSAVRTSSPGRGEQRGTHAERRDGNCGIRRRARRDTSRRLKAKNDCRYRDRSDEERVDVTGVTPSRRLHPEIGVDVTGHRSEHRRLRATIAAAPAPAGDRSCRFRTYRSLRMLAPIPSRQCSQMRAADAAQSGDCHRRVWRCSLPRTN